MIPIHTHIYTHIEKYRGRGTEGHPSREAYTEGTESQRETDRGSGREIYILADCLTA